MPGEHSPIIAAERGEVWTIDTVFTETAKWSTRHIAAYPGKDYAILAWLTREIIDGALTNLQQPVNGLQELRAALEGYRMVPPHIEAEGRGTIATGDIDPGGNVEQLGSRSYRTKG